MEVSCGLHVPAALLARLVADWVSLRAGLELQQVPVGTHV
jgi:hypothetical protein